MTLETHLDYTLGITAKIEITKNEERHEDILRILVKALESVKQGSPSTFAIHGRELLAGSEITGIVEQVNVD